MLKRLNLAHLGILVGVLYWPAEALIHDFIFGQGSFLKNLLGPDPDEIWMRTLISAMFIGFGLHARKTVVHQQQLQEKLRKKSERLHQIIDCTYDAYVSMDRNGVITGWNRSAEALFGWPMNQIIGQHLMLSFPLVCVRIIIRVYSVINRTVSGHGCINRFAPRRSTRMVLNFPLKWL